MRAQGIAETPKPPDMELRQLHSESLVTGAGTTPDYLPQWPYPDKMSAAAASEAKAWAAQLRLDPAIGNVVLERLQGVNQALQEVPVEQRQWWVDNQKKLLVHTLGTEAKADDAIANARKVLFQLAGAHKYTKDLLANLTMHDAWLVTALSNHWNNLERLNAALAKRGTK